MSIEKLIQENTAALVALTVAIGSLAGEQVGKQVAAAETKKTADAPKESAEKKQETKAAATKAAATQTTAETSAAQEKKVEQSEAKAKDAAPVALSVDERASAMKKAYALLGRDGLLELLGKFGVAKASDLPEDRLPELDAELLKVVG